MQYSLKNTLLTKVFNFFINRNILSVSTQNLSEQVNEAVSELRKGKTNLI